MKNIVLIGMRGSGKSSVGAILADHFNRELISMDALIVYEAGMTIPNIIEKFGWDRFREIEARVCQKLAPIQGIVNSTGGGVVLNPENVKALRKTGILVWLKVSIENTLKRIGDDPNRPSLTGVDSVKRDIIATYNEREKFYHNAAHYIVDTDNKSRQQIAEEIITLIEQQGENILKDDIPVK